MAAWILAILLAASPARAGELTVFAAASLKNALEEVVAAWQAETGHKTRLSLAGSATLARQIAFGAPADVFISANAAWMDYLAEEGLLRDGTRRDILGNALVLIGPHATAALGSTRLEARRRHIVEPPILTATEAPALFAPLHRGRLAMALVEAVPAGIYGKAALEGLGLWETVAPRIAQADNVRAALALVARGEAPLGIVYATDALAEPAVTVLARFASGSHPPITYPAAAIAGRKAPLAEPFLGFLSGEKARAIFARNGFRPLD